MARGGQCECMARRVQCDWTFIFFFIFVFFIVQFCRTTENIQKYGAKTILQDGKLFQVLPIVVRFSGTPFAQCIAPKSYFGYLDRHRLSHITVITHTTFLPRWNEMLITFDNTKHFCFRSWFYVSVLLVCVRGVYPYGEVWQTECCVSTSLYPHERGVQLPHEEFDRFCVVVGPEEMLEWDTELCILFCGRLVEVDMAMTGAGYLKFKEARASDAGPLSGTY